MMMPFLMATNPDAQVIKENFLDRLADGSRILLTGMLTVFAVLCIIWFCLYIMRLFFYDLPKKRAAAPADAEEAAPAEEAGTAALSDGQDDALVAVIAAAVAAYTGEDENDFRVVAFRRIQK